MDSKSGKNLVSGVDSEDFEAGDEQIEVERRPRAGAVLSIRLSGDEVERLQQLARDRGVSLSRLGREALTAFIKSGAVSLGTGIQWTVGTPFTNTGPQPIQPNVQLLLVTQPVARTEGGVIQGKAAQSGGFST